MNNYKSTGMSKLITRLKQMNIKIYQKNEFECDFYNSIDKENIIKGFLINSDMTRKEVAVKRLMMIQEYERVLREIEMLNEFRNNEYFVNFHGVYLEENNNIILVFLDLLMMNLRKYMVDKYITKEDKLKVCKQILSCLLVLHSKGIIHRDLKPENICFDQDMNIKLIDFGIVKLIQDLR